MSEAQTQHCYITLFTISPQHHHFTIHHFTIHHFTTSPFHHFTISPLHHFTTSPFHHFTTSPLHHFTTSPLHHFTTSPFTTSSFHMSYLRPVLFFFCFFIAVSFGLTATPLNVQHIAPPFWWTGMKNHNLQIMVHATDIAKYQVKLTQQGVRFVSAVKVENPNYLFINLEISDDAKAGKFNLEFSDGKKQFTYPYELKARSKTNYPAGLNSSDVMYLLMPDRFSNGDVSNDVVKTLQERNLNRDSLVYRHGGDIQGIINHLDYLYDLGCNCPLA
ncbi:MAG: cyclomaltodextrinase N-terminal domain-containing protein [Sphingobacteriales bacterium]|nr:cyclomaltodextrinase N-terminal domain-containing protein [Sphingobacteriales bacterium]